MIRTIVKRIGQGVGLTALGGTGAGLYYISSLEDGTENIRLLWRGLDRAFYATSVGVRIMFDYKWSLRGIDFQTDEFKKICSEIHSRSAKLMLKLAIRNKGVFIKAGQHLATLKPGIPEEYTNVLCVLQDNAEPKPLETIKQTIREELGGELETIFPQFDPQPLGTASLAQVHRAVLKDGTPVAVKVQHRNLVEICKSDMLIIQLLCRAVAVTFPDFQFEWIVPEFRSNIFKELNFEQEGRNAELCAKYFRGQSWIHVPKVFWPTTTKKVLTMEFMTGAKINDVKAVEAQRLKTTEVAAKVVKIFSEQIYVHGFVHCDPHPGNLLVRPVPGKSASLWKWCESLWTWKKPTLPPQVILLDHGLYRTMDEKFRYHFCGMYYSIIVQDAEKLKYHCEKMGMGRYSEFMPLIFTFRSIDSKVRLGDRLSEAERRKLEDKLRNSGIQFRRGLAEIVNFMEKIPRDMLFVLRTNNLVRSINLDLGGTSRDRFRVNAEASVSGLFSKPIPDLPDSKAIDGWWFSFSRKISETSTLFKLWSRLFIVDILFWLYAPPAEVIPAPRNIHEHHHAEFNKKFKRGFG